MDAAGRGNGDRLDIYEKYEEYLCTERERCRKKYLPQIPCEANNDEFAPSTNFDVHRIRAIKDPGKPTTHDIQAAVGSSSLNQSHPAEGPKRYPDRSSLRIANAKRVVGAQRSKEVLVLCLLYAFVAIPGLRIVLVRHLSIN